MNIPTKQQRDEWRELAKKTFMESALGEYTPPEFNILLDAVDQLERELTAAKAEIALAKDDATHQVSVIAKLDADNAQLRAEVEWLREYAFGMETALRGARASGTASETALWAAECAELRLVNSQLRARVADLESQLSDCATKAAAEYGEQLKPLFAKVRELEQDKARLVVARGFIEEYLALGGLFNPEAMEHNKVRDLLMDIADIIDGNQLSPNGLVAKRQAAIDAARAGKGAT